MASRYISPVVQYIDGNSVVRASARLWFCEPGTNTFKTTYANEGLSVANANPVTADGNGNFPEIWGTGLYKVRLLPPEDGTTPLSSVTPIWTRDNVSFDPSDISDELVTATGGLTAISLADRFGYDLFPEDFGATDEGSASANTAAFTALETELKGRNINLRGKIYSVTTQPDKNQYYNGGFNISGAITTLYDKPYDTPFGKANLVANVADWDVDTFPEALIDMEDGRVGFIYRYANDHGLINGAEKRIRISYDLGMTFENNPDAMIYRDANNDVRNSVGKRVANGRTVVLSSRRNEALTYSEPVVVYSDDPALGSWSSRLITPPSAGYPVNFHSKMVQYPASVGGNDTLGWIAFPYNATGIDAVYTTNNWDTETFVSGLIAPTLPMTALNENSVVRIGTEDKWIMFCRGSPVGQTAKAYKSTDLLTWTGPYDTGLLLSGNPPEALYEYGRVYLFAFSRNGRELIPNHRAHLIVASAEATALWDSNVDFSSFCGWQVVTSVPHWASGYMATVKANNRWHSFFKCGEVGAGGSSGPKSSMAVMITPETPPTVSPYGLKRNIPGQNFLINSSFNIWQRHTSFTITTSSPVAVTADGWGVACDAGDEISVSRQTLNLGEYEVYKNPRYYIRLDSVTIAGTNQTHYLEQRFDGIYDTAYRRCTVSFVARMSGTHGKLDAIRINQNFGTGGSPSATVIKTVATDVQLSSQFKEYAYSFDMPRIVGKTFGTDNNPFVTLIFYPLLGGEEDYVLDILRAKLEIGPCASQFVPEDDVDALFRCQRFYFKTYRQTANPGTASGAGSKQAVASGTASGRAVSCPILFPVTMYRGSAAPTVTVYSPITGAANKMYDATAAADIDATVILASQTGCTVVNDALATDGNAYQFHIAAEQDIA